MYQAYYNTVEEASALTGVEAHSLLIGDFNLLGVNLASPDSILPSAASHCIHEISTYLHCKQINIVHNINNTLLALVFSSLHGSKVLQDPDPILDIDQHHPALNVSTHVSIPDFKNCNLNAVFASIQSFSYSAFTGDVNEAFSLLTEKVRNAVLSNTHIRRIGSYRFPG